MAIKVLSIGFGNAPSIVSWLFECGLVCVESNCEQIQPDDLIIIPGVGSAAFAIEAMSNAGLKNKIRNHIIAGGKLIGICVGMHVLCNWLEEGGCTGLNVFDAPVMPNHFGRNTGWMPVKLEKKKFPTFWQKGFGRKQFIKGRAFYNHNFSINNLNENDGVISYNTKLEFIEVLGDSNVLAFQFHPEKSQEFGINIGKLIGGALASRS